MQLILLLLTVTTALADYRLYNRGNSTITKPWPTSGHNTITPTVTATTVTTLTNCPEKTKCHGETVTWTGTNGPLPCAPTITCTCVLPTAPPVLPTCPAEHVCTGQIITWSTETTGPSACASTCTVELPSVIGPKTGPVPTASNTGVGVANEGRRMGAEGMAVVIAAGALLL